MSNPIIFLSYATPDRDKVMQVYVALKSRGYNPWIDKEELLPGQKWDREIERALKNASLFVLFLSQNSVLRRSFLQKEIKRALQYAEEKLEEDIFIIPVLLDEDIEPPEQIEHLQVLHFNDPQFDTLLEKSIERQLSKVQSVLEEKRIATGLNFAKHNLKEEYDGVPGYSFTAEYFTFASDQYPLLADATTIVLGWLTEQKLNERAQIFGLSIRHSGPNMFHFGQDRFSRTNTYDAYCDEPVVKGRILSLKYDVHTYGAGAAHPNHGFHTFSFCLDPFYMIQSLRELFDSEDAALALLQESVAAQLLHDEKFQEDHRLDEKWVREGLVDWECFGNFVFEDEGILFYFPPYQVGPYASGSHTALVSYSDISKYLNDNVRHSLDIYYRFMVKQA